MSHLGRPRFFAHYWSRKRDHKLFSRTELETLSYPSWNQRISFFFFFFKKGWLPHIAPHLGVSGVMEAWLAYSLLWVDLESLFGGSSREEQLLVCPWVSTLPYCGRSSSSTKRAAPGGMHMEPWGRKGNTYLASQITQSTLKTSGVTEVTARSPSHLRDILRSKIILVGTKSKTRVALLLLLFRRQAVSNSSQPHGLQSG